VGARSLMAPLSTPLQATPSNSGMFVLTSDSFWPVIHGVNGSSQYLADLQETLNEVLKANRARSIAL
jgi:hypothetical protein